MAFSFQGVCRRLASLICVSICDDQWVSFFTFKDGGLSLQGDRKCLDCGLTYHSNGFSDQCWWIVLCRCLLVLIIYLCSMNALRNLKSGKVSKHPFLRECRKSTYLKWFYLVSCVSQHRWSFLMDNQHWYNNRSVVEGFAVLMSLFHVVFMYDGCCMCPQSLAGLYWFVALHRHPFVNLLMHFGILSGCCDIGGRTCPGDRCYCDPICRDGSSFASGCHSLSWFLSVISFGRKWIHMSLIVVRDDFVPRGISLPFKILKNWCKDLSIYRWGCGNWLYFRFCHKFVSRIMSFLAKVFVVLWMCSASFRHCLFDDGIGCAQDVGHCIFVIVSRRDFSMQEMRDLCWRRFPWNRGKHCSGDGKSKQGSLNSFHILMLFQVLLMYTMVHFGSSLYPVKEWYLHHVTSQLSCELHEIFDDTQHCQFARMYRIHNSQFDKTRGFPGEGPQSKNWCCYSANIESLSSHSDCHQWNSDLAFLQEVRLSSKNIKECEKKVADFGKKIFTGPLLKERRDKNGTFKTPHGGTAFLAPNELCKKFDEKDDTTGVWKSLKESTRITAVWYQVLPKLRILCWSFYGQTYCVDGSHKVVNNHLLEQVLLISSQFGDIPVLIGGDFQSDPSELESFVSARRHGWYDPLVDVSTGQHERPITFSRTSNFINPTTGFSSIDGILLNEISFQALQEIKVCHEFGTPRAPIFASFNWPKVFLKGTVLVKPASFDLTGLPIVNDRIDHDKIQEAAIKVCNPEKEIALLTADDETAWSTINDCAVDTLLSVGAKFNKGLHERGKAPKFRTKVCCPGQDQSGNALTAKSARLSKIYRMISELRLRLSRVGTTTNDFLITWNLQQKVASHLVHLPGCKWWNVDLHCDTDTLLHIQKIVHEHIVKTRNTEKWQRISSWKQKMIEGTRSKCVSKYVFKWINAKMYVPMPNLITDPSGQVIADPIEAMKTINDQWDSVYSANVMCENPMKVVEAVWPQICKHRIPATVPPISGSMLKRQVAKRRIDASAGLDGWRTPEMQVLPEKIYDLVAAFFQSVEAGIRNLPSILTSARQTLLDKCGDDNPMQKRIISILPIFMLSYTSLRFAQLQSWQTQVMPKTLFGGIKTRKMSQLQTQFKLALDKSVADGSPLGGLKLDKSKCFDRLIPSTSCAIMLAIGVPKEIVTVFANIYAGMRKYLSYKSWTSASFTTSANGLVQGCSFSLLAINAHMMVWSLLMSELPGIYASAYIDDAYLWASMTCLETLQKAVQITNWWDGLTGQLANNKKTVVWATTTRARKEIKNAFPNMNHQHSIEILGAPIQTTQRTSCEWPKEKTDKILKELQLIKAIPTCRNIHEHLIGTKIIPQTSFAAHVVKIPKDQLKLVQSGIVDLLWKRRPPWRARPLVLGLLAKPRRVDPVLSRSYNVIIECTNFLKHCSEEERAHWYEQFESNLEHKNFLVVCFKQACTNLGCGIGSPFHLTFFSSTPVCVLDFGIRDLKKILQLMCRNMCYKQATELTRKDLCPSVGILDYPSTLIGHRTCKSQFINSISMQAFRDSVLVGCNTTNDKRYRAGFADDNLCRFCKSETETFLHLTTTCSSPPYSHLKPECPSDCGPNFRQLGIVEVPRELQNVRLQISHTSQIPVIPWSQHTVDNFVTFWTDGSCLHGDMFWQTKGAAAAVNTLGKCVFQVEVHHVSLNSYSCELWAIIQAFCRSEQPCACRTDCASLVTQFQFMIANLYIPADFLHYEWWIFLLQIYKMRLSVSKTPLSVAWDPLAPIGRYPHFSHHS